MRVSTILFEYNYLPLLHFEKILQLEHVNVYSPWCWGYRNTNNIDYLCKNQHIVKSDFEFNNSVEAVVINNAIHNKYEDAEDVDKIISSYFNKAKVFDLRNKYTEKSFAFQANKDYIYDIYDNSIITDNLRSKRVFVFSSVEGDITSLYSQLSLFEFITREKKKAVIVPSMKIVSPNSRVVNFDWSLYKRLPLNDFYVTIKQFMNNILYSDSDYLIIGIPQNIMNVNQKCDNEIGVIQFLLSQVFKIDALVINIPSNGFSEAVLSDIRELLKKRYECNEVYIINSNILYQKNDDGKNAPIYLSEEKLAISGAQNSFDCINSFSIFDELMENVFSKKIIHNFQ